MQAKAAGRQVSNQFDYSKTLISGALLQESLAEDIRIEDNAIIMTFETTFEGIELAEFSDNLREIRADQVEFNTNEDFNTVDFNTNEENEF